MLIWISLIYTVYALVRFYTCVMEIGFVLKAKRTQPVILSASNFIKAGNYKIATSKMELLQILYDLLIFFWWFDFGLNFLDRAIVIDGEILKAVVFVDAFIAINYVLGLPFDLYKTFSLDKKFGFSNMMSYVV